MIYTTKTKHAMQIAYNAHHGQLDKTGIPYIYHPIHLAEQMDDENSTIVALLHDVVEDSDFTIQDLISEGFNDEIINAILCLTHDKSVPYEEYILLIKLNALAKKVKLADLKHNSTIERYESINEKALKQAEKYNRAIKILSE